MKLRSGKIPIDVLKEIVFRNLGAKRNEVIVGPSAGIDAAVLDLGNRSLVVSMDPITGALERIGRLAVHVNANDVATFGVEPAFLFSCILLPEGSDTKIVDTICLQMSEAAKELKMAIVGGHCEVTPGLHSPIVVGCVMGTTRKGDYVTSGGAKPGDTLVLTKSAGIEGTAILASDREEYLMKGVRPALLARAKASFDNISVVKEAIAAFGTGGVRAMHDPTEGGIIGGVYEMAEASKLGVEVLEEKIPVQPETAAICKFFGIDPLRLVSSGALLVATKPKTAKDVVDSLRKQGVTVSVIGKFHKPIERILIRKNGTRRPLEQPETDHLWLALEK